MKQLNLEQAERRYAMLRRQCYKDQVQLNLMSSELAPLRNLIRSKVFNKPGRNIVVYVKNKIHKHSKNTQQSHLADNFKKSKVRIPVPLIESLRRMLVSKYNIDPEDADKLNGAAVMEICAFAVYPPKVQDALADAFSYPNTPANRVFTEVQKARDASAKSISTGDRVRDLQNQVHVIRNNQAWLNKMIQNGFGKQLRYVAATLFGTTDMWNQLFLPQAHRPLLNNNHKRAGYLPGVDFDDKGSAPMHAWNRLMNDGQRYISRQNHIDKNKNYRKNK